MVDPPASAEALTNAARAHEVAIQELRSQIESMREKLREAELKHDDALPERRPTSWRPVPPEKFHGKAREDPYDWFFELDCFFDVATDLDSERSRVSFTVSLLRGDALKWWRQAKASGVPDDLGYVGFKTLLCARFRTTDPVRDARDQLAALKQTHSARAYSSIFRTTALSIPDLSIAEALDRYIRGLKSPVKVQVMLHSPRSLEDAMRLAETYDSIMFIETSRKPGYPFRSTTPKPTSSDAMEVDSISRTEPGKIAKLTPELREKLRKEGKCFFCRESGHMVKNCPKKADLMTEKPKN